MMQPVADVLPSSARKSQSVNDTGFTSKHALLYAFFARRPRAVNPNFGRLAIFADAGDEGLLVRFAPSDLQAVLAHAWPDVSVQNLLLLGRGKPLKSSGLLTGTFSWSKTPRPSSR